MDHEPFEVSEARIKLGVEDSWEGFIPMGRNKTFNNLMDSIKELHDKKNHDYANEDNPYSNFEFASLLIREFTNPVDQSFACLIGIKLARLGQLLSGKEPNNESVEDTMRDLTTYCGIWAAYMKDLSFPGSKTYKHWDKTLDMTGKITPDTKILRG